MWRWCLALSFGLSALSAFPQSGSSKPTAQNKPFLIGADWQEGASPAVKELFWETGCNFVRLTGGGYGWIVESQKRALAELNRHGVRVLLQLGSHYPDAKYFDLKDAYFVDQNGKTGVPSRQSWAVEYDGQAWPQYSYASCRFRTELEKDFTAYFNALGPLTGVEALLLHNEPGYFWLDKRIFDYNPASIEWFRKWLPSRHATIADLNRRWGTTYDSFSKVEPPHDVPTVPTLAPWIDWRRSNTSLVADFLSWESAFAHRIKPGLPTSTNLSGPIDNWFPYRLGDNYRFTSPMDIASIDIYPGSEWTTCFFPGYSMDMTRGAAAGKPIYVAECESYAASRYPKLNDEQRASRLGCDLWTYIGHGANAVLIWTLNGQDEFRLTNGEYNARLRTLRETAYATKMLHLGEFRKPNRKVAVVVDRDSYLLVGNHEDLRAWADKMSKTALGLYGALAQAHIETDVITTDTVRNGGAVKYKALVLAAVETMDLPLASAVTKFAEAGGLVVADASLATDDGWGRALPTRPGFGLHSLFGVQIEAADADATAKIAAGSSSFIGRGKFNVKLQDATPLAHFDGGETAVSYRRAGKGGAIFIASNPGFFNAMGADSGLGEAMGLWLVRYARISAEGGVLSPDTFVDSEKLADSKGNSMEILTDPPNQGLLNSRLTLRVKLPTAAQEAQTFVLLPSDFGSGTTSSGPRRVIGDVVTVPGFDSRATILTARDHTPLLATDSPTTGGTGRSVAITTIVYNPSPRPLVGTMEVNVPAGWSGGRTATVNLPAYGHAAYAMKVTAGAPTKRAVLKVVLLAKHDQIESIPFDIEIK